MRHLGLMVLLIVLSACGSQLPESAGEPLRFAVDRLPEAYVGEPYQGALVAAGGVRPYTYELKGELPPGLRFEGGRLLGVPKKKGRFRFAVTLRDAALNVREANYELLVGDPPPPRLRMLLPESPTSAPFIWVVREEGRRSLGFQARFSLKGLRPDLKTLQISNKAVAVFRWVEKDEALDIDLAWLAPVSNEEVLRLTLVPLRELRPRVTYSARFYGPSGELFAASSAVTLKREGEGRYRYPDLLALAREWKKKATKAAPLGQDLNGDGVVDEKDLQRLREDYAWAIAPSAAGEGSSQAR